MTFVAPLLSPFTLSTSSADEVTEELKLFPCGITLGAVSFSICASENKNYTERSGNVQKLLKLINKLEHTEWNAIVAIGNLPQVLFHVLVISQAIKKKIIAQFKGGICFVNFQLSRWHNLIEVSSQYVFKTFSLCIIYIWLEIKTCESEWHFKNLYHHRPLN